MTVLQDEQVLSEDIVVDRSPELLRGAVSAFRFDGRISYLQITAEHIHAGKKGNGAACALALAYKEQFGLDVDVSGEHPTCDGLPMTIDRYMAEWIGKFDRGEDVQPFEVRVVFHG